MNDDWCRVAPPRREARCSLDMRWNSKIVFKSGFFPKCTNRDTVERHKVLTLAHSYGASGLHTRRRSPIDFWSLSFFFLPSDFFHLNPTILSHRILSRSHGGTRAVGRASCVPTYKRRESRVSFLEPARVPIQVCSDSFFHFSFFLSFFSFFLQHAHSRERGLRKALLRINSKDISSLSQNKP